MTTDLRGGADFNSIFLHRSFLNLTVKKYENWSTFADVIVKVKVAHSFETRCINQFIMIFLIQQWRNYH